MCTQRGNCWLGRPVGALAVVAGAASLAAGIADVALPLTGHDTLSTHAGRHPMVTGLLLLSTGGALGWHFNSGRSSAAPVTGACP